MQDTMHPVTTPAIPPLQVGSFSLRSRLVVGTGKYKDFEQTRTAIEASGADAVTVAVARPFVVVPVAASTYLLAPLALNCTENGTPAGTETYFDPDFTLTFAATFRLRPRLTGSGAALAPPPDPSPIHGQARR